MALAFLVLKSVSWPRAAAAAGAEGLLVDKGDRVATLASLVTSNSSIIIQRGKEKTGKSQVIHRALRKHLLGPGRMLLGTLERGGSKRDKNLCMVLFLLGWFCLEQVVITAVIPEVYVNFPFQLCVDKIA